MCETAELIPVKVKCSESALKMAAITVQWFRKQCNTIFDYFSSMHGIKCALFSDGNLSLSA